MEVNELRKALKEVMAQNGLTNVDVAAGCKVDPDSVERFLGGAGCYRLTKDAYERFVLSKRQVSPTTRDRAIG